MSYPEILLLLALSVSVTALWLAIHRRRKLSHVHQQQHNFNKQYQDLKEQHQTLKENTVPAKRFQADLNQAAFAGKLQLPSITGFTASETTTGPPEKYQYISELIANGFDTQMISSLLRISTKEADQLITLSRIANH